MYITDWFLIHLCEVREIVNFSVISKKPILVTLVFVLVKIKMALRQTQAPVGVGGGDKSRPFIFSFKVLHTFKVIYKAALHSSAIID